eukprot:scaffold7420_cov97-Isochrysis_galbana.AAC.3
MCHRVARTAISTCRAPREACAGASAWQGGTASPGQKGTKGLSMMFLWAPILPWPTSEPKTSTAMRNAIRDVMSEQSATRARGSAAPRPAPCPPPPSARTSIPQSPSDATRPTILRASRGSRPPGSGQPVPGTKPACKRGGGGGGVETGEELRGGERRDRRGLSAWSPAPYLPPPSPPHPPHPKQPRSLPRAPLQPLFIPPVARLDDVYVEREVDGVASIPRPRQRHLDHLGRPELLHVGDGEDVRAAVAHDGHCRAGNLAALGDGRRSSGSSSTRGWFRMESGDRRPTACRHTRPPMPICTRFCGRTFGRLVAWKYGVVCMRSSRS